MDAQEIGGTDRLRREIWKVPAVGLRRGALSPTAQVAVVGGGVLGLASALALARGGASVVLLEQRRLGFGASGRNVGLYLPSLAPHEHLDHLMAFREDTGDSFEYLQSGHLALATDEATARAYGAEAAARIDDPPAIELLDPAAIATRLGVAPGGTVRAGRWYVGGGMLNPWRFLNALARTCVNDGVRVAEGWPVRRIEAAGDGLALTGERGTVRAARALLATGAWTARLLPGFAGALPLTLRPAQMIALRVRCLGPGMATGFGATYWRGAGEWALAGGRGDLDRDVVEPGDFPPSASVQAAILRTVAAADPRFAGATPELGWAGVLDATPDGKPAAGPVDTPQRLWVACGLGGHGLPPALGLGKAVAAAMLEGAALPPALDVARFAQAGGAQP